MSSEGQKDPLYRVKVADSITDLIGVTPCVRLGRLGRYNGILQESFQFLYLKI